MPRSPVRAFLLLALAAVVVVVAAAIGRVEQATSSAPPPVPPRAVPPVDRANDGDLRRGVARLESDRMKRGETLDKVLDRLGVEAGVRTAWIEALGQATDLRRLRPGTGVAVGFGPGGDLDRVALRPDADRFVRVVADEGGLVAETVEVPVDVRVRTAFGVVESSVAMALADEPHAGELVVAFADVFQWDVDLFVDPRPGDVVRIVYETRVLGDLPPDAPGFGKLPARPGAPLGIGRILAAEYDGRIARSEAYWVPDGNGGGDYFDADGSPLRKAFLRSPLNYRRISSGFSRGRMHPVLRKVVPHHGVDFAADAGTPVVASADGRVVSAGWDGALGKAVRVRHGNGFVTIYGHLRAFARGVRTGAAIEQNQVIGYVGATGRATGPHLHYSMLVHGRPIDPLRFENPPVESLPDDRRPELARALRLWSPILRSVVPATATGRTAGRETTAGGARERG